LTRGRETCGVGYTFLQENSFQQRVLVAQHQTFVGSGTVALLEVLEVLLMLLNRRFKLLDVFGPSFTKRCLRLAVPLLSFFRGGIDLYVR
jgi:hypothetical protein